MEAFLALIPIAVLVTILLLLNDFINFCGRQRPFFSLRFAGVVLAVAALIATIKTFTPLFIWTVVRGMLFFAEYPPRHPRD
jgi:uncharacterized membrane protein YdcZ (DUF606 family)